MSGGKHVRRRKGSRIPVFLLLLLIAVGSFGVFKLIDRDNTGSQDTSTAAIVDFLPSEDTTLEKPETTVIESGKSISTSSTASLLTPIVDPEIEASRQRRLVQAKELYQNCFYNEALAVLGNPEEDDPETAALIAEIQAAESSLVTYSGQQYYHIFFHSLIVDPTKAFDYDADSAGYDTYMTTVNEFQSMLPLLYENDFILVDITELVSFESGKAVLRELRLPAGKKPLVLSVDDVNYYDYMTDDGFAERLDVDENGRVVTVVNGEATYDGDVMPILDAFVAEHPDFSWHGAKGIVAITGYEGAFGYRITDLEDYPQEKQDWMLQKVKDVAQALRSSGWKIACHSYTHNQYWTTKTITMEEETYDISRWLNEIAPYVGSTNIFISPFGVFFDADDSRFRYLVDNGFSIYCPVDSSMPTYVKDDFFIQCRINLDGYTIKLHPERISRYLFDPSGILDPARPK